MGDPRRLRKAYARPARPWHSGRIEEEKALLREYGLKNKQEIYKAETTIRNIQRQAKRLVAGTGPQIERETRQLLDRLTRYGMLKPGQDLEDVLNLTSKNLMERRLQTILFRQHKTTTMKQARQAITHGHVQVAGKKVSVPSYMVPVIEESQLSVIGLTVAVPVEVKAVPPKQAAKEESEKDASAGTEAKASEPEEKVDPKNDTRSASKDSGKDAKPANKESPKKEDAPKKDASVKIEEAKSDE